MRILIATDSWHPQINGVLTTILNTIKCLKELNHEIQIISTDDFYTFPLPWYKEIPVSYYPNDNILTKIEDFNPTHIHISTEAPVGLYIRRYCLKNKLNFTSSYHTDFPSYCKKYFRVPKKMTYSFLKWFHKPSKSVMIANETIFNDLSSYNFKNLQYWSRGVDTDLFVPRNRSKRDKPLAIYIGRVSPEKNIEDFLDLDLSLTKRVVGDGPSLNYLKNKYKEVEFTGAKTGEDLAKAYAEADVFVFPSKTDTFGLVMIEALACGVPVAAYPILGPKHVITDEKAGCLDNDLKIATEKALKCKSEDCRNHALKFSWNKCTEQFINNLIPL